MDESRKELEELRRTLTRSLHVLQIQAAKYGIATPPHIQIGIEDTRKEIADLDRQLAALPVSTAPDSGVVSIGQTEQLRRQQLQQRYDALKQEADAANKQIINTIDEGQRVRLQRTLDGLYQEMGNIERQLA